MTGREPALDVARGFKTQLGDAAAIIDDVAEWADDALAGGIPPKFLLRQLITANRLTAAALRGEQPSHETAAWLAVRQ